MTDSDSRAQAGHSNTSRPVDLRSWDSLTPSSLWLLIGRLTIGSWVLVIGTMAGLFAAGWSLSAAYFGGWLPSYSYAFHNDGISPRDQRVLRNREDAFRLRYSDLVDWQKLSAIVRGIEEDRPDGLETPFEIAASLLAQVRSTRGTAYFLAGDTQHSVTIELTRDGEAQLEWEQDNSIIPRIAADAGYNLSDDELRTINANLNWAQFSYLDDEMEHAVIYRGVDGSLGLVIHQPDG
jgi:hypothetical protein